MSENAGFAYPCPACRTPADLDRGCPGCGRPPDPDAAAVIQLDREIAGLAVQERDRREAHAAVLARLAETRQRREALAARVRVAATAPASLAGPVPAPPPPAPGAPGTLAPAAAPAAAGPETSALGIQTLLFVIGGLLLGSGAIVFAVVAWTTFGVAGQAAILAAGTGLALLVPVVALRRRLRGTAETFAVIGLLLVLLDGYAGWRAGLVGDLPGSTWAGLVTAATGLLAVGYRRWTRLDSPRFGALALAQPPFPLLMVEPFRELPSAAAVLAGIGYLAVVLAAGNLAVVLAAGTAVRAGGAGRWWSGLGWAAAATWWVAAGLAALTGLGLAGGPGTAAAAGGALLAGTGVLVAAAGLASRAGLPGAGWWAGTAAAAAVLAPALAAGRVAALAWPGMALLAVAAVVLAVAAAAATVRLPAGRPAARRGRQAGALTVLGAVGGYAAGLAVWGGLLTVAAAWSEAGRAGAAAIDADLPYGWQVLAALGLLGAGLVALAPAAARAGLAAGGLALVALAGPAALGLGWWAALPVDLLVAAGLLLAAATRGGRGWVVTGGLLAAGLAGHALVVGLATAAGAAAVLAGLVLLGVVAAIRAAGPPGWRGSAGAAGADARGVADDPGGPARLVLGRAALLTGLVAWPPAVAAGLAAAGAAAPWPGRAALAAGLLLLGAVAAVRFAAGRFAVPGYLATAAGAVHVLTPVAVVAGLADPAGQAGVIGAYAAAAALGLAGLGLLRPPAQRDGWLALRLPVAGLALLSALPPLLLVLAGPYAWLGRAWSGGPAGVGLVPPGDFPQWRGYEGAVLGLVLLTAAAGLAGRVLGGGWRAGLAGGALVAPVALLTGLAELGAQWPVVPATSLALGVAWLLIAALRLAGGPGWIGGGYGLVLAGAGLAGALPARWSTLAALSGVLVAAVVIGVAGRAVGVRVAGWVGAVGSAAGLAVAATLAADLPLPGAGFAVLGVAVAALGLATRLSGAAARAVAAAANAAAAVALLLAAGAGLGRAGGIAVLWGVALGVRALRPGEPAGSRTGWAAAAGGTELLAWWLLLGSREVTALEAYTLPAALAGLAAGWWVRRSRPELGSWLAYGPGLAAAALPSLYLTLVDPVPLRRLLLGAAAVAVVVAGARRGLRAPVLLGGAVAVLVGLRELGLLWQRLDTWIPLTAAGLLLVGLAATYERRRRDLARLRAALSRMA
jgi:hypothetical protein